jgi:hypothetical protein
MSPPPCAFSDNDVFPVRGHRIHGEPKRQGLIPGGVQVFLNISPEAENTIFINSEN